MANAVRKIDRKFGDRTIANLQRLIHNELSQNLSAVLKNLETIEHHVDDEGEPLWKVRQDEVAHFDTYSNFLKAELPKGLSISPLTLDLIKDLKESLEDARSEDPQIKLKLSIRELTDNHVKSLLDTENASDLGAVSHAELIGYLSSHRDLVFRSYLESCAQNSHLFTANAISKALTELFEIARS